MNIVDKEGFEAVKKSVFNLYYFYQKLTRNKKVIKTLLKVPNVIPFAEQYDLSIEQVLSGMMFIDVINTIDSLFGETSFRGKGGASLYCFISYVIVTSHPEPDYSVYLMAATDREGEASKSFQDLIDMYKNWELNATTTHYKTAILLSKVNDDLLCDYWKHMYHFFYSVLYAEESWSDEQKGYLDNIIEVAKKALPNYTINYSKPVYIK